MRGSGFLTGSRHQSRPSSRSTAWLQHGASADAFHARGAAQGHDGLHGNTDTNRMSVAIRPAAVILQGLVLIAALRFTNL